MSTTLRSDISIAEEIKKEALTSEIILDTNNKFYKEFVNHIAVPKTWEEKEPTTDTQTEFFCFKAKLFCETHNHSANMITYKEDGVLKYALLFRDFLIDMYRPIDFYQDIDLKYYLQTVNPKLGSPWKYA